MKKNMKFHKKVNSNHGGALLSVIIVMAIVGILGALILSVAYTNFNMKAIDRNSKNNFYTAEMILEEVCTGLEVEASNQYKEAYEEVMKHYYDYSEVKNDITAMKNDFGNEFVVNMVAALQMTGDSSRYNLSATDGLASYVKNTYPAGSSYTVSADGDNSIDTLEDGLCLRNVKVTYTSPAKSGSYYNSITTDIKIVIPEVGFSLLSKMPEIADYSFISEGGVNVIATGNLNLNGKAYAGVSETSNGVSVAIDSGANMNITGSNATLFVSKGDISLNGINSEFNTGANTSLWTESITVNSTLGSADYDPNNAGGLTEDQYYSNYENAKNIINILGRSYVKDDTTLNGIGNILSIGGQYYGYSNDGGVNAAGNSAIIINGNDTTLDMSTLNTLVLAGTSFVGTAGDAYDQLKNSADKSVLEVVHQGVNQNINDILMGDSVAIKSNQLVYLVPTDCQGVVSNPMTYTQYEQLISNPDWKNAILSSTIKAIRKSLSTYGTSNVDITPVFTNRNGGSVYLYIDFADANLASRYFMDYYKTNNDKIRSYMYDYLANVRFNNNMSRVVTQGNYLVKVNSLTQYQQNTGDVAMSAQEFLDYDSSYRALCAKLITNIKAVDAAELSSTVYKNLVNEEAIEQFFTTLEDATELDNVTYTTTTDGSGKVTAKAVINPAVNETKALIIDNEAAYTITAADLVAATPKEGKGIIIATGDIYVNAAAVNKWNGLIICGGKMSVNGGTAVLNADPDGVGTAMLLSCKVTSDDSESVYTVFNFFKSGQNYNADGSNSESDMSDIRNCINFENYRTE